MKLALSIAVIAGASLAARLLPSDTESAGTDSAELSASDTDISAYASAPETDAPLIVPFELDLDLATALHRAGLGPEQMACGGLNAGLAQTLIQNAGDFLTETGSALYAADDEYAASRVEVDSLSRVVRSGLASKEEIESLAQAKVTLEAAAIHRTSVIEAVFAASTQGLDAGQVELLTAGCHNAEWHLPVAYHCADRTQQEWVDLRDALANERICAEDGSSPDGACQGLLAEIKAEAPISKALVGLETHGPSIQASWNAALEE